MDTILSIIALSTTVKDMEMAISVQKIKYKEELFRLNISDEDKDKIVNYIKPWEEKGDGKYWYDLTDLKRKMNDAGVSDEAQALIRGIKSTRCDPLVEIYF